jgi:hypothetical protein
VDAGVTEVMTRKPCSLPEDEKRFKEEIEEDEEAGIYSEGYVCQFCTIGDQGLTEQTKDVLKAMNELSDSLYGIISDSEIWISISNFWNNTLYKMNKKLGRNTIQKMTKAGARLHYTQHNRNRRRDIDMSIDFLDRSMLRLQAAGVWEQAYEMDPQIGEEVAHGEPEVNIKNWKFWKDMNREKVELLKVSLNITKERENRSKKGKEIMNNITIIS